MKPKRPKKEKKEVSKEKKQEPKEVIVPEEPSSPQIEEESKTVKEDAKPKGSYALADMEKATFDAVYEMMCSWATSGPSFASCFVRGAKEKRENKWPIAFLGARSVALYSRSRSTESERGTGRSHVFATVKERKQTKKSHGRKKTTLL